MTLLKIATVGHPVLRRPAQPVPEADIGKPALESLIEAMVETMRDASGAGLAAPQVYVPLRVCVIELAENPRYPGAGPIPLMILINPRLSPLGFAADGTLPWGSGISMYEGCLSVPNLRGRVRRPRRVAVEARDRLGAPIELLAEGVFASVIQHEVDHLDATLFVDRADPKTLTTLTEYERHVSRDERIVDEGALPE